MGTPIPVTATDAQVTSALPVPVKAIPDLTLPAPVTVIPVKPPMAESQLGGSYIKNTQVHDGSNICMCSSDSDGQENLKSHLTNRLSNKIYNTFRELFSNINIDSVWEILPKINKYNREIARFIKNINAKCGIALNYTKLEISEIKHWAETFHIVANMCSLPEQQQSQAPKISVKVLSPQAPAQSLREQQEQINRLKLKFLVYSVLEPAVGYLTTLHFNSQHGTHPT